MTPSDPLGQAFDGIAAITIRHIVKRLGLFRSSAQCIRASAISRARSRLYLSAVSWRTASAADLPNFRFSSNSSM